jgi:hypothetical protein
MSRLRLVVAGLFVIKAAAVAVVQAAKELRDQGDLELVVLVTCIPALLLTWAALAVVVHRTSIRAVRIAQDGLELTGVCREFVDANGMRSGPSRVSVSDASR